MNLLKLVIWILLSFCVLNAAPQDSTHDSINTPKDTQSTLILKDSPTQHNDIEAISNLPLKSDLGIDMWRYVVVLLIMVLLILALWIVKRGLYKQPFKNLLNATPSDDDRIHIIATQHIDSKHKILILEACNHRYIVLIGANAPLLLDSYAIEKHQNTP